ncbi:hypothetical protein BsWGS_29111 [Bradybaena similaris]
MSLSAYLFEIWALASGSRKYGSRRLASRRRPGGENMANQWTTAGVVGFLVIVLAEVSAQNTVVVIEPNVRQLLVANGSRQTLDCYVTVGRQMSPQVINWTGPRDANFTTTRTDNRFTYHNILTIDPFTASHTGLYTCTFSADGQTTEATITLLTTIENKIEGEFFFGNKTTVLECTLTFPDTTIQASFNEWLKNNASLSGIEQFSDYGNGTLVITNPKRSDSGLYTARYDVTGVDGKSTHDCEVVYSAAPLVLDMAKSKNIIEGDTLYLECLVKGYPPANITWLKDSHEIVTDGERILLESYNDIDNARLIIKRVTTSDAGNFNCTARGTGGQEESSKSIRVRVKGRLEWLWPVIGILCEAVALAIVIFACSKIKKDDAIDKPADEREGLLRQGSARNRDQDKHD